MSESFDVYCDSIIVTMSPWGANLSFRLQEAHPSPTAIVQPAHLGTVRMSNEHLKVMAFILKRQVMQNEFSSGVDYPVPTEILSQIGIAREDWDAFWRQ